MPLNRIKRKYNVLFAFVLFTVAALRHQSTGIDTGQYFAWYRRILNNPMPLNYYFDVVVEGLKMGTYRDGQMWELIMKCASYVIPNAQLWMAFAAGFFIFAAYKLIKRYSYDPIISWVYIYCIFIFSFILQGLRQSFAMAIILLSFKYVDEEKLGKFLLLMALAFLFHQSSIVFIIVYPMAKIKVSRLYYIPILGALILAYIMPGSIVSVFQSVISDTRFGAYYVFGGSSTLSIMGWVLLMLIFSFCFVYRKRAIRNFKSSGIMLTVTMIGLVFQAFVAVLPEMFRISYYFNMFNMILAANTCTYEKGTNKLIIRYGFILACFAYMFYAGVFQYKFFWQA